MWPFYVFIEALCEHNEISMSRNFLNGFNLIIILYEITNNIKAFRCRIKNNSKNSYGKIHNFSINIQYKSFHKTPHKNKLTSPSIYQNETGTHILLALTHIFSSFSSSISYITPMMDLCLIWRLVIKHTTHVRFTR